MKFSIENGIRIAEVPANDFRIILYDDKKKSMGKNRCNAGFFGNYKEKGEPFTLPVGHLVCDYEAKSEHTLFYCKQRGSLQGNRFCFDSGKWEYMNTLRGKEQSTLVVADGKANVLDLANAPKADYAISGVPVMRNGKAVKLSDAHEQGWSDSSLYGTYHVLVGVKESNASSVYVIGMKTSSWNLVYTGEAARKLKAFGLRDVIKLDGGGSFYFNAGGMTLATNENRRVCTIIDFGEPDGNPYPVPTTSMRRGSSNTSGVCWLQWELTEHGYPCEVDGGFGAKTDKQLRAYQKANGLKVDGSCGSATRASLLGE